MLSVALPISVGSYAAANAGVIADRQTVAKFTPSPAIQELVDRSGMNDVGEFIFFTTHPELNTSDEFNAACGVRPTQLLLGCFTGTSIHVFDVTDPQVKAIREVTAAHEMLHAAYARLDNASRDRLDALLEEAYAAHGEDAELSSRMESYEQEQPGTRLNELHSIIGTEFVDLSPELEAYYARYFTDRSIVTGVNASVAKVFSDVQAKADDLSAQIVALVLEVNTGIDQYNAEMDTLNADIDAFNAKNLSYGYSGNEAGFNADRAALVARIDALDARRTELEGKQDQIDVLKDQLSAIDSQAEALNQSIDSTFVPEGTV